MFGHTLVEEFHPEHSHLIGVLRGAIMVGHGLALIHDQELVEIGIILSGLLANI